MPFLRKRNQSQQGRSLALKRTKGCAEPPAQLQPKSLLLTLPPELLWMCTPRDSLSRRALMASCRHLREVVLGNLEVWNITDAGFSIEAARTGCSDCIITTSRRDDPKQARKDRDVGRMILALSPKWNTLRTLEFWQCDLLGKTVVAAIRDQFPQLQSLRVWNCKEIGWHEVFALCRPHGIESRPSLEPRYLDIAPSFTDDYSAFDRISWVQFLAKLLCWKHDWQVAPDLLREFYRRVVPGSAFWFDQVVDAFAGPTHLASILTHPDQAKMDAALVDPVARERRARARVQSMKCRRCGWRGNTPFFCSSKEREEGRCSAVYEHETLVFPTAEWCGETHLLVGRRECRLCVIGLSPEMSMWDIGPRSSLWTENEPRSKGEAARLYEGFSVSPFDTEGVPCPQWQMWLTRSRVLAASWTSDNAVV